MYRQGDVLVRPIQKLPDGVKKSKVKRVVLAEGEVTGHCHEILDVENVELLQDADGNLYLDVKEPAELTHQEHSTITIPPGTYEIVRQREYSPEEIRRVAD